MCWRVIGEVGQGVRTGLGHGVITCVLQTQFLAFIIFVVVQLIRGGQKAMGRLGV